MMTDHTQAGGRWGLRGPPPARLLWAAATAGIVLWSVHLAGMAALPTWACRTAAAWSFHALTLVTLVPTAAAILPCWQAWRAGEDRIGGHAFVGAVGVLLNLLFLLAIVAEWVPVLILDGCLA